MPGPESACQRFVTKRTCRATRSRTASPAPHVIRQSMPKTWPASTGSATNGGTRAARWRPLHRLNPVRIRYLRDLMVRHFAPPRQETDTRSRPLAGLRLLDIGSGGGLLSEPLARLGADVTGIDPSPRNVATAERHAAALEVQVRLSRRDGRSSGRGAGELRRGAGHGGGRARSAARRLRADRLFAGAARRPARALDAQPHRQELHAGHRGGRICARLGAARHPPLGAVPDARGAGGARCAHRACGSSIGPGWSTTSSRARGPPRATPTSTT